MKIKIIFLTLLSLVILFMLFLCNNRVDTALVSIKNNNIKIKKIRTEVLINRHIDMYDINYKEIDKKIDRELQIQVDKVYKTALYLYDKYKDKKNTKDIKSEILDLLEYINNTTDGSYVFVDNYNGDIISGEKYQSFTDADGRSIALEKIQMVRKKQYGYINTKTIDNGKTKRIFVKDLGFYDWFIGSALYKEDKIDELKKLILNDLCNHSDGELDIIAIYKKDENLCKPTKNNLLTNIKNDGWHTDKSDRLYYVKTYKPFNWHIIYGFLRVSNF